MAYELLDAFDIFSKQICLISTNSRILRPAFFCISFNMKKLKKILKYLELLIKICDLLLMH